VVNEKYPERWIGRNGPMLRDFFLWGHLKQLIYGQPINSAGRVGATTRIVQIREDREVFSRVSASTAREAHDCIAHQRQYFQHLL
jgi:hypothetical protein